VSAPPRPDRSGRPPGEEGPKDEEFARTYAAGYEEGVRSALREVLGHASRGHTTAELRMLIESRLARLSEEVELKRRSLLGPPRQPAWSALLRPAGGARPWQPPVAGPPPLPRLAPGGTLLVREERPRRALEVLRENAARFPRVAIVSLHPPELPELRPEQRIVVPLGTSGDGGEGTLLAPGEIGGRLKEPLEADGGALVYVDALEFLATEHTLETTLRFVQWLEQQAGTTGSAVLASIDPRALELRDLSRLERTFQSLA
jgi:hypothetical protein